jgi:hypothetical protein
MAVRQAIDVSLTDFVDFALSSGTPKLTKVATLKKRGDYHPALDFWRPLREGIVEYHESNAGDPKSLDTFVTGMSDPKKVKPAQACVKGYKRFLGKKTFKWFAPVSAGWGPAGMRVRVNPEVGARINDVPHLLKLYFKAEALSKRKVDMVLLLMHEALKGGAPKGAVMGIVDVPRGKLFTAELPNRALLGLLMGEAMSFKTIWESLDAAAGGV